MDINTQQFFKEEIELNYDGKGVPFEDVKKLLDILDYGSEMRVAILIMCLTGCRPSELESLNVKINFIKDFMIWFPGKNQKGYRKEKLPDWFLKEFDYYIKNHNFINNKLFQFNTNSMNRYFNQKIRPKLNGNWIKKRPLINPKTFRKYEYIYQLKSFRKNFGTLDFFNNLERWGEKVAIEFTANRMAHSSYKMTAKHYIQDFHTIGIERYKGLSMADILKSKGQTKLMEFF